MDVRTRCYFAGLCALLSVGLTTSTCSSPPPAKPAPVAPPTLQLWGDMKPVVSVKELMRDMLDPIADNIFDAVSTVVTAKGVVETGPKTDADWDKIRIGAVTLAEGAYLLKVPRPFTPPDEEDTVVDESGEVLTTAQIKAKVEGDLVQWNARIEALRNVGLEVLDIVKRKDAKELWDASDNLDAACENCHVNYWYPGEDALFKKLDHRLEELYATKAPAR